MNFRKALAAICAASLSISSALAVPAKRTPITVTQPDGTILTLTLAGDEFCHFYLTPDHQVVLQGEDDTYYFATTAADGRLTRSDVKVTPADTRTARVADLAGAIELSRKASPLARRAAKLPALEASGSSSNPSKGVGLYDQLFPTNGERNALVILVQFSDKAFTTQNAGTYFNNMLNQQGFSQNGATGSVRDYFIEASMGQFKPTFDVYGPVTLPQNMAYYGSNVNGVQGNDKAPWDMVRHAADILKSSVDFSKYDTDGDGNVDNVYIIYAGKGEASGGAANTVWPHSYDLQYTSGGKYKVGSVYFDHYACSNEIEGSKPDGIGTFVHEFSHVMGLPDLYTTDYGTATTRTPGAYSVLDYGPYNNNGRTPPTYSAFERNALGWIDLEVLDGPANIEMEHILTSNKAYIIPTGDKNEFFLFENRQQKGSDKYIPGHGMLVWHIHFVSSVWEYNTVNNSASHQYVDIVEACDTANNSNNTTMQGYPFPGSKNKTEFTATTTPALKTWSGRAIELPITDITEQNGVIRALVDGGANRIEPPVITEPTAVTENSFTLNWQPVAGATDYLVSIWGVNKSGEGSATCDFKSSSLPSGWSATKKEWYSTFGNYGAAAPAMKFSSTGRYLQTCEFDGNITSVSFWSKAMVSDNSKPGSKFNIFSGTNSSTTQIASVTAETTAKTYTVSDIPAGTTGVTFKAELTNGNLSIDDIVIHYCAVTRDLLDGYNEASTSGRNSLTVDRLPQGINEFEYTVTAVGPDGNSKPSERYTVTLSASGIDDIEADINAPAEYFNLQGIRVDHPTPGRVYIVRQGSHISKKVF